MASYVKLIGEDVFFHHDASLLPSSISEFVRSLQNKLRIPLLLKSGPVPYTDERVVDLLNQLRADVSCVDLWDSTDDTLDEQTEQQLHVAFNAALADCARIRAVVDTEILTGTRYPKESFLVVLVRNVLLNAHARLSCLEDIPVVLPRHFSGEAIPIINYMTRSFHVPLVVSVRQEMPIQVNEPENRCPPSDAGDSSADSELFQRSPPTMSEFLDGCESIVTPEEDEQEQEPCFRSSQFEAHFLASSPSATPPPICHLPVLCMADEEKLPVLMSSLLYQRRVWHISDSLIGLEFSKYDTVIRIFVGWLEDDLSSDRVLPRVHMGEIGTSILLDLSVPSVALIVSRLLHGLEPHISDVCDAIRHSVGGVGSETQTHLSYAWRLDTDIREEDSVSIEKNSSREIIIEWVKSRKYSMCEGTMPPHPRVAASSQSSYPTSRSSAPSDEHHLQLPELREPHDHTDSVPTFCSRLSCSAFAATTEKSDRRVFRWMFDRRVVPQSLPSDLEFCEEYRAMTGFIWPDSWNIREDLPPVDAALEPYVHELLEGVAALKTRQNAVTSIAVEEFPFDLQVLGKSFSAIFQASCRSRKKKLQENVYEASWRHDHDRLLFDFFIRLMQPSSGDLSSRAQMYSEDPLVCSTLEATLRLPRSANLLKNTREKDQLAIAKLLSRPSTDLLTWVHDRGGPESVFVEEVRHAGHIVSQWSAWVDETNAETEASMISKIGQFPSTGRCDALGYLLVEFSDVSSEDVGDLSLVVRATGKYSSAGRGKGTKASKSRSNARTDDRRAVTSSVTSPTNSLIVPERHSGAESGVSGTRYTIPSSSIPSAKHSSDEEQTNLLSSVDELASKTEELRLGSGTRYLELPILAVEYKKASDSAMKGTNQVRMYLAASVKFLQAVGITNVPVYGVQTDGPIVVIPAAVLRDDDFVYLFERLVERLDISTPVGAWHYVTILCRLARRHAKALEQRFEDVRKTWAASSSPKGGRQVEAWTIDHQMMQLKAENRAKSPSRKQRSEVT